MSYDNLTKVTPEEQTIDHSKLRLSHLIRYIDDCEGIEIPYPIAKAMFALKTQITEYLMKP